jgi:hypothetical protein
VAGAVILTLIAVAVLGVLAKIGWDAVEILREDRRRYGRVGSYAALRVGIIVVIVLLFLGYLALGWVTGAEDPGPVAP